MQKHLLHVSCCSLLRRMHFANNTALNRLKNRTTNFFLNRTIYFFPFVFVLSVGYTFEITHGRKYVSQNAK